MPSYHLFNHKAGSVSSIYSTFGFRYRHQRGDQIFEHFFFTHWKTIKIRSQTFRALTEDEGDTEPPSQFPKKRTALGRETFRPPHYHGTRFPERSEELQTSEKPAALTRNRRGG